MAIGCGAKCAKFMLIVFNIIFWLSGCAILAVGIWMRVDPSIVNLFKVFNFDESDPLLEIAAYVLIGMGVVVFLVGFLGCCGAIKENKCMLGTYVFLLLLIMAGELAAGVMAIIFKDKLVSMTQNELVEKLRKDDIYKIDQDNKATFSVFGLAMSTTQLKFECCGVTGFADYTGSQFENRTGEPFPLTCCVMKEDTSLQNGLKLEESVKDAKACQSKTEGYYFMQGCKESLEREIESNAVILIGLGIGVACLEIFGFIFAICLCRNTGTEE